MANLYPLNDGENLLIYRRREGVTQIEMARRLSISRNTYNRYENSTTSPVFVPMMTDLKDHERCLILRRRKGRTQEEIADHLGISRMWVNKMEAGQEDCAQLMKLWSLA